MSLSVSKKIRLVEFDILKFFAIFLVLYGHTIQHLNSMNRYDNSMFVFISSFHMPLFMLISGFFAKSSLQLSFGVLFRKKFIQLIYPCISFGLLFIIVTSLIGLFDDRFNTNLLDFRSYVNYLWGNLWFLKSAFFCYVILFLSLRLTGNSMILGGGVISLIISQIFPAFKVNSMFPFFLFGYIVNFNIDVLKKHTISIFWISLTLFIIFLCNLDTKIWGIMPIIKKQLLEGDLSALNNLLFVQFYKIVMGICGSMTFVSLIFMLSENIKRNKIISLISECGKQTLGIYITQSLILEQIMANTIDLSEVNHYLFTFILSPIISLIVMYLCLWIIDGINRKKAIKKVLFGKK